jgi:ABC-type nitrate/sulfonate/bicarbonate transport system permease component
MGAEYGLGYLIMQASRTSNTEVVIIGTLIIGLEAFLLETLLKAIPMRNPLSNCGIIAGSTTVR